VREELSFVWSAGWMCVWGDMALLSQNESRKGKILVNSDSKSSIHQAYCPESSNNAMKAKRV
jgi:hypothetical protein